MSKINTVIVHGSLGSGKTTLLSALLRHPSFQSSFIIENEFANTSIDIHAFSEHGHQVEVYDISGGCICCTSGQELVEALAMLADRRWDKPLIIETTGVAQSAQLIKQLYLNQTFIERYNLVQTIYVVDPTEVSLNALKSDHFFDVVLSDALVISKVDLIKNGAVLDALELVMQEMNPEAAIFKTGRNHEYLGSIDFEKTSRTETSLMRYLDAIPVMADHHGLCYSVESVSKPVSIHRLHQLEKYIREYPELGIKRVKGYVIDETGQWWHIEMTAHHAAMTPSRVQAQAVVVVIGASIPENFIHNALY